MRLACRSWYVLFGSNLFTSFYCSKEKELANSLSAPPRTPRALSASTARVLQATQSSDSQDVSKQLEDIDRQLAVLRETPAANEPLDPALLKQLIADCQEEDVDR
eukprot:m.116058 g.116058  ORF g.116058 m.116058 type:complete len:105 (+) comp23016_c0_seq1:266-580(+)